MSTEYIFLPLLEVILNFQHNVDLIIFLPLLDVILDFQHNLDLISCIEKGAIKVKSCTKGIEIYNMDERYKDTALGSKLLQHTSTVLPICMHAPCLLDIAFHLQT